MLGFAPRYLARTGFKARQRLFKIINTYFTSGDDEHGLGVLKARRDVGKKYGASIDEISRFELGDCIGVLINATSTLFWTLLHIYSNPSLLASIRAELSSFITTTGTSTTPLSSSPSSPSSRKRRHIIDITTLQQSCPLLLSTYRETLRTHTKSSTSRWVTHDTYINNNNGGTYLLKKDSALLIPGALIHADPSVWGPDAKKFSPYRFMSGGGGGKSPDVPKAGGANRPWGGGQTLCPGRFFATAEITGCVALMVARFDMEMVGDKGWVMPEEDAYSVATSIHPPKGDVRVRIREREEFEGDEWAYRFVEGLD